MTKSQIVRELAARYPALSRQRLAELAGCSIGLVYTELGRPEGSELGRPAEPDGGFHIRLDSVTGQILILLANRAGLPRVQMAQDLLSGAIHEQARKQNVQGQLTTGFL